MKLNPLVSVVMPVFNAEKYLSETIESVLGQSFSDFELIIVDDGSTDSSKSIINSFNDNRIRVIENDRNIGVAGSSNVGVDASHGQYIARIDADDICFRDRFMRQVNFLQSNEDVVVVGSSAKFISAEGSDICIYTPNCLDQNLRNMFPDSPFINPSVMFTRVAFYMAGKYNEKLRWGGEDVTLFQRMSKVGKLHNLAEPLICYRLVPGSLSRKPPTFRKMLTDVIKDEISGVFVSARRFELLELEAKSIDKSKAEFDYSFEVAKLYLWSGGEREKIFSYLKKCIKIDPLGYKAYIFFVLALAPKFLVKKTYFYFKHRAYSAC